MHYHQTSSEKSAKASISVSMVSRASVVAQVAEQQLESGRAWFESRVELWLFQCRQSLYYRWASGYLLKNRKRFPVSYHHLVQ